MKLHILSYLCPTCRRSFDAPALPDGAYGEFLLWSKNSHFAYLNAFSDKTFKEVDKLLAFLPQTAGLTPLARAKILQRFYGEVACDPDALGAPFRIDAAPPCPRCKDNSLKDWAAKEPPQLIDIVVPPVTHQHWRRLNEGQKHSLLYSTLTAT